MFFDLPCAGDKGLEQDGKPVTNKALKLESKRLFIIAIAAVVLFAALFAAIFLFRPGEAGGGGYGNTQGNLWNGGLVAESSGWIYYSSSGDSCLYKARPDGRDKTKLADGLCYFINAADGWVYYVDARNGLCKVRTDGTEFTKLDDYARQMFMENGWIYYTNRYLYKIRTNGTDKTQLGSGRVNVINIYDGWIYFNNYMEVDSVYRMRMDGTDETKLNIPVQGIFEGDYIYYDSGPFLCRIRTDGTGFMQLSDELNQSFNVSEGWIYYSNVKDNKSLHKMRIDGTDDVKLNDSHAMIIHIFGDWIYYYTAGDDVILYRINTDGTENQRVE